MAAIGTEVTVALSDAACTQMLKRQNAIGDLALRHPRITPISAAFRHMAREQKYDVSEMAVVAFLQAREAHKPLVLLPVVITGGFHHRSLIVSPRGTVTSPVDLKGRRVGVRSYSQTTGLWVRAWLNEEYGVQPKDITWIVNETSHVEEFQDPDNVILSERPIAEALRVGAVDAMIAEFSATRDQVALVMDADERQLAWFERHGCIPINHMVVATNDMADRNPTALEAIYELLTSGINESVNARDDVYQDSSTLVRAPRHGLPHVRTALALAADYALDQGLIRKPVRDIDSLFAFAGEQD